VLIPFKDKKPLSGAEIFIAPDALISGDVRIGKDVTVLFGAIMRGDLEPIIIGEGTNIQDRVVVHTSVDRCAAEFGKGVTVGHSAIIHGAKVEDDSLIGMGATILDEAIIPRNSLVGAGALVTENKRFPEGHLIIGSPAKAVRPLREEEMEAIRKTAIRYQMVGGEYAKQLAAVSE